MNLLTETGWAPVPVGEPALAGEVTCDVAVVGGGVGGMTAALRLAESGADVVLLEAQTCGWGASSRNAGYVTNSIAADPSLLALLLSRSKVRALFQFAEAAVEFAQDAIEHRAIDCDFEKVGIVLAAVSKGQLRKSRRNAKILSEAGSSAEFVDGRDAGLPDGFLGGVREGIGGDPESRQVRHGTTRRGPGLWGKGFRAHAGAERHRWRCRGDCRDGAGPGPR
nr:FAD-dependent oxidoreductase [Mycolicibacterium llatzerense]